LLVWLISAATILAILLRPKRWTEAVWACSGAVLLIVLHLIPLSTAAIAVGKGTDVYLFLAGMMLLAELARREGVFDWLAAIAIRASRGSRARLFTLVYLVGIVVTTLLSNDATAVVLTPAVYAAVRKARVEPLPYLFACAFIANAASFVLPISNPANLVLYGSDPPPLGFWLKLFLLPSMLSIASTWIVLYFVSRQLFEGPMKPAEPAPLTERGKWAARGIAMTGAALIAASARGWDLGFATFCAAAIALLAVTRARGLAVLIRGVSWSVLPLVAGLFVLVEALSSAGAVRLGGEAVARIASLSRAAGLLAASFGIAALSNLVNNLPSGLLTSATLQNAGAPENIRHALLIGVDLGPNLSVTGSLATILWLVALRREKEHVSAWTFFKVGVLVMPPTLFLSTLALLATTP
jgi:arsenical pump membrane protein